MVITVGTVATNGSARAAATAMAARTATPSERQGGVPDGEITEEEARSPRCR